MAPRQRRGRGRGRRRPLAGHRRLIRVGAAAVGWELTTIVNNSPTAIVPAKRINLLECIAYEMQIAKSGAPLLSL